MDTSKMTAADRVMFAEIFEGYYYNNDAVEKARTLREDCRRLLEPVIRADRLPIGDTKAWKAKQPEYKAAFITLETPKDKEGKPRNDLSDTETKQLNSRVAAWLGVLRTCLEYQILPTDKNADRLRKKKAWTGLNGNGKVNPLYQEKPTESATTPTAMNPVLSEADAEKVLDKQIAAMDKADAKKGATALDKMESVLDTATMTPSKTAPQTGKGKVEIPRANVSNPDGDIPPREHCGILLDQLFKNESFRSEFAPILAACLDSSVATVTRCLVEARDAFCKGNK